jgi:hypothetical protein
VTWRHLAAWAWLLFGAVLAALWAAEWALNGVPDGWWRRITEPGWVLLGLTIAAEGARWLRALRVDPTAKLPGGPLWPRKQR